MHFSQSEFAELRSHKVRIFEELVSPFNHKLVDQLTQAVCNLDVGRVESTRSRLVQAAETLRFMSEWSAQVKKPGQVTQISMQEFWKRLFVLTGPYFQMNGIDMALDLRSKSPVTLHSVVQSVPLLELLLMGATIVQKRPLAMVNLQIAQQEDRVQSMLIFKSQAANFELACLYFEKSKLKTQKNVYSYDFIKKVIRSDRGHVDCKIDPSCIQIFIDYPISQSDQEVRQIRGLDRRL